MKHLGLILWLALQGLAVSSSLLAAPVLEVRSSFIIPPQSVNGIKISELSGLAWDKDEQLLYAISDKGHIFHFRLALDGNRLVAVEGTPLAKTAAIDPFELVRTVAAARIMMPRSMVRLSAGRESMSDELQALCFAAGANSIFYGEKLLTTGNPDTERDQALFARLGLRPMQIETAVDDAIPACSTTVHAGITEAA